MSLLKSTAAAVTLAGLGLLAVPQTADAGGFSLGPQYGAGYGYGGFNDYGRFSGFPGYGRGYGSRYGSYYGGGYGGGYYGGGYYGGGYGYGGGYYGGGFGRGGHVGVPVPGHLVPHGDHFDLVPGHPPGCTCGRCRHRH